MKFQAQCCVQVKILKRPSATRPPLPPEAPRPSSPAPTPPSAQPPSPTVVPANNHAALPQDDDDRDEPGSLILPATPPPPSLSPQIHQRAATHAAATSQQPPLKQDSCPEPSQNGQVVDGSGEVRQAHGDSGVQELLADVVSQLQASRAETRALAEGLHKEIGQQVAAMQQRNAKALREELKRETKRLETSMESQASSTCVAQMWTWLVTHAGGSNRRLSSMPA